MNLEMVYFEFCASGVRFVEMNSANKNVDISPCILNPAQKRIVDALYKCLSFLDS